MKPPKAIQPFLHKCAGGGYVDVHGVHSNWPAMGDGHLISTLKMLYKKAATGFVHRRKNRLVPVKGEAALSILKYDVYLTEAKKRNLL